MAVTKIHAIKSTLGKAIKYICNEQKTDSQVLISSFGCAPQTADLEFNFLLSKNKEGGPNLAYHMIQSFAPGEINGEEAHRISQELADQFLQGKYAYVLATHVDRDHIHSHIIFCSVNTETNNVQFHALIILCIQNETPSLLYYLNPTPNDRNLEWDMNEEQSMPQPGRYRQS